MLKIFKRKEKEKKPSEFEQEAEIASNWWTENLGPNAKQNNGDFFQSVMMQSISNGIVISEEQKEIFKSTLKGLIIESLERRGFVRLEVDYGCCYELSKSAIQAGLGDGYGMFPIKTSMDISKGKVVLRNGYRAEPQELITLEKTGSQPGDEN